VFENRELRRIFGPKRKEITRGWVKLSFIIYIPHQIRVIKTSRMRWAGHVTGRGKKKSAHKVLVG
jgi:hypothetical protein